MKVLSVTECFEAGTGMAVSSLAAAIHRAEVALLYSGDRRGIPTDAFECVTEFASPRFVGRVRQLMELVDRTRPDIVHSHSSWAGVYTRVAGLKVPVVYQPHCFAFGNPSLPSRARAFSYLAERALVGRTDALIAVAEYERAQAAELGHENVHVVPNVSGMPAAAGIRLSSSLRVVMIGRIAPQKDPDFFAGVADLVRQKDQRIRFTWVGDGDARLANRLRASGVDVTGWIEQAEIVEILRSSSLYLHSGVAEGFPIGVLDAASQGLPIVARDVPSLRPEGLHLESSSASAADHVLLAHANREVYLESIERTLSLVSRMNMRAQAARLRSAYESVLS